MADIYVIEYRRHNCPITYQAVIYTDEEAVD